MKTLNSLIVVILTVCVLFVVACGSGSDPDFVGPRTPEEICTEWAGEYCQLVDCQNSEECVAFVLYNDCMYILTGHGGSGQLPKVTEAECTFEKSGGCSCGLDY